jgi:low temperature requirement protein LtrA
MSEPTGLPNDGRVSTTELFFDIVFVFTITQLTRMVAADATLTGVRQGDADLREPVVDVRGLRLADQRRPASPGPQRLLLLVGMAGFLVCALAIPDAFGAGGVPLGVGYILVTLVHDWMLLGPIRGSILRAMGRLGPANFVTAVLVLAAGFAGGWLQWTLWSAAFALHWLTPFLTINSGYSEGPYDRDRVRTAAGPRRSADWVQGTAGAVESTTEAEGPLSSRWRSLAP